jgi:hypothetical protein
VAERWELLYRVEKDWKQKKIRRKTREIGKKRKENKGEGRRKGKNSIPCRRRDLTRRWKNFSCREKGELLSLQKREAVVI